MRRLPSVRTLKSASVQYSPCPCLFLILGRTGNLLGLLAYPDRAKPVGLILGDLATIDVFFGARHVYFANDFSTTKLPESK
jgi:hypothetical protein